MLLYHNNAGIELFVYNKISNIKKGSMEGNEFEVDINGHNIMFFSLK